MSDNRLDEMIRSSWRELGFFYEWNDEGKTLTLTGSQAGLLRFSAALSTYASDPNHVAKNEHEHYGPYFLKVMTSTDASLDNHTIRGSLQDLERLAQLVEDKVLHTAVRSTTRIRDEFAPESQYCLVVDVREDGFDPASLENL